MKKNRPRKYPENRLSHYMSTCDIDKHALAERMKTSEETVRRWLAGETDLTHGKMVSLAKIFGCDPHELIISTDEIIDKRSPLLTQGFTLINNYLSLEETDRANVDEYIQWKLAAKSQKDTKKITPTPSVPSGARPPKASNGE